MIGLLFVLGFCYVLAWFGQVLWLQLANAEAPAEQRWFLGWVAKGIGIPLLAWLVLNSGMLPSLPPLMWQITGPPPPGAATGFLSLARSLAQAAWFIGTFWAAVTFGWLAVAVIAGSRSRGDLLLVAALWSFLLLPVPVVILALSGWVGAGLAMAAWLGPVASKLLHERSPPPPRPSYSRAIARLNAGKFTEAEWEIIAQLEQSGNDFEGWLLLADLYANHFHDLPAAEVTIYDLCLQPAAHPSNVAVAVHRLADWHLKLANDPVAARHALEIICERYPGTHVDLMARQRLQQLPATREELLEQRAGKRLRLPGLRADLDTADSPAGATTSREEFARRANQQVAKLERNPNDVAAREELARLLAEDLGKTDAGLDQIELLLGMPDQPSAKRAEWLGLLAGWHLRYRRDAASGQKFLEQLVREHPETPQALAARGRLKLMALEQKWRQARASEGQPKPRVPWRNGPA